MVPFGSTVRVFPGFVNTEFQGVTGCSTMLSNKDSDTPLCSVTGIRRACDSVTPPGASAKRRQPRYYASPPKHAFQSLATHFWGTPKFTTWQSNIGHSRFTDKPRCQALETLGITELSAVGYERTLGYARSNNSEKM